MASSDDLGRVAGSGVPTTFNGEDIVVPAIDFERIGEVSQYILSKRPRPGKVLRELLEDLGDILTEEDREKMLHDSLVAGRKLSVVSSEELAEYLDSIEGLVMTIWLGFEDRYPGKYSKTDVMHIIQGLDEDEKLRLFQDRDQAMGMDELGNSTGRTPEP